MVYMKKWLAALIGLSLTSSLLAAGDTLLKPGHPNNYVVVKGDTLWDISGDFLNDPWKWPEIWQVNPQVSNPHLIYPGDVLSLVYVDGQPKIMVKRGGTVKLSPQMRESEHGNAIQAIPLGKIDAFLSKGRFVDPSSLKGKPYIIAGGKRHIVAGAGDQIYARGEFAGEDVTYGVFREEQLFTDPDTNEVLGLQLRNIASTNISSMDSDIATMEVNRSSEEIRIGDKVLVSEQRAITAVYQPSAPSEDIAGLIIGVEDGVTQVGKMSIVIINRGERDGLIEGNVLSILKVGEIVRDKVADELVQLPDERAGLMMVFRVYDKLSYGLVLRASQGLSVDDKVAMP
jgi:nucleoid-associated protein YgaU